MVHIERIARDDQHRQQPQHETEQQTMTATISFLSPAHALQATMLEVGGVSDLDLARKILDAAGGLEQAQRVVREAAEECAKDRAPIEQQQEPECAKFEVGKTYTERSICNYDTVYSFTIVRRTAKSVWFTEGDDPKVKMRRISKGYRGHETFSPHGSYSMSCTVSAERGAK